MTEFAQFESMLKNAGVDYITRILRVRDRVKVTVNPETPYSFVMYFSSETGKLISANR